MIGRDPENDKKRFKNLNIALNGIGWAMNIPCQRGER